MTEELRRKIQERAYQLWEYRQYAGLQYKFNAKTMQLQDITAEDDWIEAERLVLNENR